MTKETSKQVNTTSISGIRLASSTLSMSPNFSTSIDLTVGEIDLDTPIRTKEAGIDAITNNITKYTENQGFLSLRRAISDYILSFDEIIYSAEDEILVTVGAGQGIEMAIRSLTNPGDEVIVFGPAYPAYIQALVLANVTPVIINTAANSFRPTAEQLRVSITPKTKLVILNYPNNPTGVVLSKHELEELSTVIVESDLYAMTDDIYQRITYSEKFAPSIVSLPNMKERTIVVNGLSKSHSMTGWRIGYVLAPKRLIAEMYKIQQATVGCASSISQKAAITALTVDSETPKSFLPEFELRREYVLSRLDDMGLSYIKPEGAFYIFVDIRKFHMSSWEFVAYVANTVSLALVHGSAFTKSGEGYIRISFAKDMIILTEAMNRLETAIGGLEK